MADQPLTASAVISFVEDLETRSARFYSELAGRFPAQAEAFEDMAQECAKNKLQVVRTYQETVSDALETGFSFEGLSLANYAVGLDLAADANLGQALALALQLEQCAVAFYQDVAERSQALLATIPKAFQRVARRHAARQEDLAALQGEAG